MDDLSGNVIRGYELRERIGAGGFGAVYEAYQAVVGREVAIKVILPEFANQPDFVRNFEAEARLVARLEHPHIIPLYDYWRDPSGAYLVMRWLQGGSLRAVLQKRGALPPEEIAHLLDQIASALMVAHRNGVVHRDLKPDNILLDDDGNAYLADFGIAKDLRKDTATQADRVVGSPAYLAPEQIKSAPISPQTDIYGMGIVLYELLTGERPFSGDLSSAALLFSQLSDPLPPLYRVMPDLPHRLDDVLQHATAKDPAARYADVRTLAHEFREALEEEIGGLEGDTLQLIPIAPTRRARSRPTADLDDQTLVSIEVLEPENPYKGLRAFQEFDSADFFGREALTEQLLARLRETGPGARFLAVVGPSGSGKSSVVKAGVLPALRHGALPNSERWFIAEMTPGAQSLKELEAALLGCAVTLPESYNLYERLGADERGLLEAVEQLLPPGPEYGLVLLIDQFEEVFTHAENEEACAHFLNSLLAAIMEPASRLRVIVTLRADFYDRPLLYPAFGNLLRQHTEVVLPLLPEELVNAIVGPAERAGLMLEEGLVEAIVAEVGEQPGALPLLQYALTELFERREGLTLSLAAYRDSGGVLGALARRADELYVRLSEEQQRSARHMFLRLVTLGEGTEDTRRRARQTELMGTGDDEAMKVVLDLFGKFRLLTFDRDPETRIPTIEVAHEALIRTWDRLREWLNSSRETIRLQQRLTAAVNDWNRAGRDPSFLAIGARLTLLETLLHETDVALNQEERNFIEISVAERERSAAEEKKRQAHELELARQAAAAQRQSVNRLRYLAGAMALFVVVAMALSFFAFDNQNKALNNAATATIAQGQALQFASTSVANAATATVAQGQALQFAATSVANAATATVAQGQAIFSAATSIANASTATVAQGQAIFSAATSIANASTATVAQGQALNSAATATIAQGQALISAATSAANFTHSEALRLAAEANAVAQTGSNPELAGLLSIRSITTLYTTQGDKALVKAASLSYPLQTYSNHKAEVYTVAYSPDGKYILTGGEDKLAILQDAKSGELIRQFTGHTGAVMHATFSPDGKYVLTGSADKTIRLWDAESGETVRVFSGHTDEVYRVVFSADGSQFVSASADTTARLWDTQTGQVIRTWTHPGAVTSAAFSPDGKSVLTGCDDRKAYLWDVQSGEQARVFEGHTAALAAVAFAPDGEWIATGSLDKTARVWDVNTGKSEFILLGHTDAVFDLAFTSNSAALITVSGDRTARLWDLGSGQEVHRFEYHSNPINALAIAPDGQTFVTGSSDWLAALWAIHDDSTARILSEHTDTVHTVAFSSDGRSLLTSDSAGDTYLRDLASGMITQYFGSNASSAALSPDGKYVLTGEDDGAVQLWDVETAKVIRTFTGHTDLVARVFFSPDGRYGLSASLDKTARLWDIQTGRAVQVFSGHTDGVEDAVFSPDGTAVLTASLDETARLWDVKTGNALLTLADHSGAVETAAFSPDGKTMLTGSEDGTLKLRDAKTGAVLKTFTTPGAAAYAVVFSPDGKLIAAACSDAIARLWETQSGELIRQYGGHTAEIYNLAFSPDGKRIVTGSVDKTVQVWETDYRDTVALLCDRLPSDFGDAYRAQYGITDSAPTCPHFGGK